MHTCPPPKEKLDDWFTSYSSIDGDPEKAPLSGTYGHLLLEQSGAHSEITAELKEYFESAHLDAREYFHEAVGIDLHPDASGTHQPVQYPRCLPTKAKRGLFGEVLAGLITECFDYVGGHTWTVPVFLFREHGDAEQYIFALSRDPTATREIYGRHGSDFVGLVLARDRRVQRIIVGEAKWRKTLSSAVVKTLMLGKMIDDPADATKRIRSGKGVWSHVNKDTHVPLAFRQLARILEERDPEGFGATILSLEALLLLKNAGSVPRTDLVLIAGNHEASREPGDAYIGWETKPADYTRTNDLQVVEVIFQDGHSLADTVYDSLWDEGE